MGEAMVALVLIDQLMRTNAVRDLV
jgi:hypothetical protein